MTTSQLMFDPFSEDFSNDPPALYSRMREVVVPWMGVDVVAQEHGMPKFAN